MHHVFSHWINSNEVAEDRNALLQDRLETSSQTESEETTLKSPIEDRNYGAGDSDSHVKNPSMDLLNLNRLRRLI